MAKEKKEKAKKVDYVVKWTGTASMIDKDGKFSLQLSLKRITSIVSLEVDNYIDAVDKVTEDLRTAIPLFAAKDAGYDSTFFSATMIKIFSIKKK